MQEFFLECEVFFACDGFRDRADGIVPDKVAEDVAVEDCELMRASDIAEKVACFFVAEAVDVGDEPFAAGKIVRSCLQQGLERLFLEKLACSYNVACFVFVEADAGLDEGRAYFCVVVRSE